MHSGKLNQSINGILNTGVYQLVEEKILTEAATSVTFSNLNGDVDEEYRLIIRAVNGYAGTIGTNIIFNNDTSNTYGSQQIYGLNTTVGASRATSGTNCIQVGDCAISTMMLSESTIFAKSGFVRTIITKSAERISTTTINTLRFKGAVWNNTADNITTIKYSADQANGLGIGTHLLLFKRNLLGTEASSGMKTGDLNIQGSLNCGVMQKIYQTTLASAATSVTISGLDGNTDTLYELRARIVNGYAGDTLYTLTINTDNSANYGYQYLRGIATAASAGRNSASGIVTNTIDGGTTARSFSNLLFFSKSGYVRSGILEYIDSISGTTVTVAGTKGLSWNNTADNITQLVLTANQANGLGIGTVLELWALKRKI